MTQLSGPHVAASQPPAKGLVIFLHGYGANGDDLIGLVPPLAPILPSIDFMSPNAPEPCRSAPFGLQWFPIPRIDGSNETEMLESAERSAALLNAFIDTELAARGLTESECALVGFSQGTMIALHIGLRRSKPLAGIVGFSGRLAMPERLADELQSKPPVLLIHGEADEVLSIEESVQAQTHLNTHQIPNHFIRRPNLGHGIDPEGLGAAAGFLRDILPS